jgi:hypothetical protein
MLKFISTDTESKTILSSVFKEQENVEEFLKNNSAEEIKNHLESISERSIKKDKNSNKFVNKIIEIMLYEISNKINFSLNDATKILIEKLSEISLLNNKENIMDHLETLINFYYVLANNFTARYYLIQKIFKFLNENFKNKESLKENKFKFEVIENLVFDFLKQEKAIDKKDMHNFFELFCEFIKNTRLFKNLEKYIFINLSILIDFDILF